MIVNIFQGNFQNIFRNCDQLKVIEFSIVSQFENIFRNCNQLNFILIELSFIFRYPLIQMLILMGIQTFKVN